MRRSPAAPLYLVATALLIGSMPVTVIGQSENSFQNARVSDGEAGALAHKAENGTIVVSTQTFPRNSEMIFTFSGDVAGTIGNDDVLIRDFLETPGDYNVVELVPPGWSVRSIQCDDSDSTGELNWATFRLGAEEQVGCRFINLQRGTEGCRETLGRWPIGPSYGVAATNTVALYSSGAALVALDVLNASSPQVLGIAELPELIIDFVVDGDVTYLLTGPSYEVRSIVAVDISDPSDLVWLGSIEVEGSFYREDITSAGRYVYFSTPDNWLRVYDFGEPTAPVAVGLVDTFLSTIYDMVTDGDRLYVTGSSYALQIYDIQEPTTPVLIGDIPSASGLPMLNLVVQDDLAFIANTSHLIIADVSDASAAEEVSRTALGRTLAVAVDGNNAFVAFDDGLFVIDVSNTANPEVIATLETPDEDPKAIAAASGAVFVATEADGLQVVDVSHPSEPSEVARWGGFEAPAESIEVAGESILLGLGYGGELLVLDTTDLSNIGQVGTYEIGGVYGVAAEENLAYITARSSGFHVIDIEDPAHPARIGSIENGSFCCSVEVQGDYAFIAGEDGVRTIDVQDPTSPLGVGFLGLSGSSRNLAINGDYAYVAAESGGLRIIDISLPAAPTEVANEPNASSAYDVVYQDGFAYVANHDSGLRVIDVRNPLFPLEVGRYDTSSSVAGLVIVGDLVYLSDETRYIEVIDVSDPAAPIGLETLTMPSSVTAITAADSLVYVAQETTGVDIIGLCGQIFLNGFETGDLTGWVVWDE